MSPLLSLGSLVIKRNIQNQNIFLVWRLSGSHRLEDFSNLISLSQATLCVMACGRGYCTGDRFPSCEVLSVTKQKRVLWADNTALYVLRCVCVCWRSLTRELQRVCACSAGATIPSLLLAAAGAADTFAKWLILLRECGGCKTAKRNVIYISSKKLLVWHVQKCCRHYELKTAVSHLVWYLWRCGGVPVALTPLVMFAVLGVSLHAVVQFHQDGLQAGVHPLDQFVVHHQWPQQHAEDWRTRQRRMKRLLLFFMSIKTTGCKCAQDECYDDKACHGLQWCHCYRSTTVFRHLLSIQWFIHE